MSVRNLALASLLALTCCSETDEPGATQSRDTSITPVDAESEQVSHDVKSGTDASDSGEPLDNGVEDAGTIAVPDTSGSDSSNDVSVEETSLSDAEPEDATLVDVQQDTVVDISTPDVGPFDAGIDTTPPPPKKLWLLSIDNGTKKLQVVDVETGKASDLCDLAALDSYPSLTFSRLNGLYGSRGGYTLDRINPCTCDILSIGGYGGPTGVFGITADPGDSLFGVATSQDISISIEVAMGMATTLGSLGINFTTSGATYSQDDKKIYAINGGDNKLYTINMKTGAATEIATLNYNFGTVGIEVHPANNKLYACSSNADLLEVDPATGNVTVIGSMNQSGACTNLAAPWFDVDCISVP